jgi:hypothetical protein
MRKFSVTLVILALLAGPAGAHRDRILHIEADGSIQDIPAAFGPARLVLKGLGSDEPLVQLRIRENQTTLPSCVTRMIRTTDVAEIRVTGSWYHDEKKSLPYYLGIQFFDPGYDPKRNCNSSHEFLFNLHNAKLIHARTFEANQSGNGGQSRALELPADCKLNMIDDRTAAKAALK